MTSPDRTGSPGVRGVLAPVARLDRWLDVVLIALVAVCAIRYVTRHELDATGGFILAGAAVLAITYAARPIIRPRLLWLVILVGMWAVLTVIAPSFAWTAVPVAFAVLGVLPFEVAAAVVVVMTVIVSGAWLRISDGFDPTVVVGPVGIALVTVIAFRRLQQESHTRQRLLDDLTAAQAELAASERRAGALAERTRLSREIHDSVGQGLSSINLLLNAAEQAWDTRPDAARTHVQTAAATARQGLDEVRQVVRDLAPSALDDGPRALAHELARQVAAQVPAGWAEVRVHGAPAPVPAEVAGAVLRSARGALANVVEHAEATRAVVSLTYQDGELRLDVRDDGRGFDPARLRAHGDRGRGLAGLRDRAAALGGRATIESAPGDGTTVSIAFPLAEESSR